MTTKHRRHRAGGQNERVAERQARAEQAAMGEIITWASETLSLEEREQFWERVVAFEMAATTDHFRQLTAAGVELPEPASVDDENLSSTLWVVIAALARMRVFIGQTDHLSDRELYVLLWHDVLREAIPMMTDDRGSAWHVDLAGGGAEDAIYLKYYADDEGRKQWLAEYPDHAIPAREDPPYDRDRYLPRPSDDEPPY